MPAAGQFPQLVDDVYDAALDPALWSDVLVSIGAFVGGEGGGIVSKDLIRHTGTPNHHFGVDPHFVRGYIDSYCRYDSLTTLQQYDVGQVMSVPELMPYDEYLRGVFHNEWMRPQRWIDAASCILEKSATSFSLLTILRSPSGGPVDDNMRRRVSAVVPHIRRSLQIGKAVEYRSAKAAALAEALDGLNAAVMLLDAGGRIAHSNAAACEMLTAGDVVRSSGGRLLAAERQSERHMTAAIAAAARGDSDAESGAASLALVARDGALHVAHVLPIASGARREACAELPAAAAAVFIRKAEMSAPPNPDIIARTYGLTPMELRTMLTIVEAGGVAETADALGVSEATVKTHLHRLFGKTGTKRQADLVKLVAGHTSPLAG